MYCSVALPSVLLSGYLNDDLARRFSRTTEMYDGPASSAMWRPDNQAVTVTLELGVGLKLDHLHFSQAAPLNYSDL